MNRSKMIKNLMLLSFIIAAFIGSLFPTPGMAGDAGVIVITNNSVPVSSITQQELEKIYTGKKTRWDKGIKIIPVVLYEKNVHETFLSRYIKKSPSQFNNYWKRQVFTGRGKEPIFFKSREEVIEYIKNTKGAIGYLPSKINYDELLKSNKIKILSVK